MALAVKPLLSSPGLGGVAATGTSPALNVATNAPTAQISAVGGLNNQQPIQQAISASTEQTGGKLSDEQRQKMVSQLADARAKYPGQDQAILDRFVEDNKIEHPEIVQKVEQYTSQGLKGRTGRTNNPTAFTTDVAQALGLEEGKDYIEGDKFPGGSDLHTAKLNGEPIQATIDAFDKAAAKGIPIFTTDGKKPRWTYITMSNEEWSNKTPEQKKEVVQTMLQHEGGAMPQYSATDILNSIISDNYVQPKGTSVKEQAGGVAGGLLKGWIKGSQQRVASMGDPISNWIVNKFGGKGAWYNPTLDKYIGGGGLASPEQKAIFEPQGTAEKIGGYGGRDILPALGAIAGGAVGLGELGVNVPGAYQGSKTAIGPARGLLSKALKYYGAYEILKHSPAKGLIHLLLE